MKTIIAGSRGISSYALLLRVIAAAPFTVTSVVSGMADGVDMLGVRYAREKRLALYQYPALWKLHGVHAGVLRNRRMAQDSEALIALWDGTSPGTQHMIRTAQDLGLRVFVAAPKKSA